MSEMNPKGDGAVNRHGAARNMAEASFEAEQRGETARADALFEQAEKTDPDAVIDAVTDRPDAAIPSGATDDQPEMTSETVVPGSDAPSRAGITGSGSGADNQGL